MIVYFIDFLIWNKKLYIECRSCLINFDRRQFCILLQQQRTANAMLFCKT